MLYFYLVCRYTRAMNGVENPKPSLAQEAVAGSARLLDSNPELAEKLSAEEEDNALRLYVGLANTAVQAKLHHLRELVKSSQ